MTAKHSGQVTDSTYEEMRQDFRAVLSTSARICCGDGDSWLKVEIVNLSFGGVKVRLQDKKDLVLHLPGTPCRVKAIVNKKEDIFGGHVVWSSDPEKEPLEMGIQFEGLSVDDKADLVALFMWNKHKKGRSTVE